MATTSSLRQRMIEDMTIRNLSPATQQTYIYAVRKFSRHFGTSPDRLSIEDVSSLSASSHRQEALLVAHQSSGLRAAILPWRHDGPAGCVRADRQWEGAGKAAARSGSRRDRPLPGGRCGIAQPSCADDGIRSRAPHRGGLPPEGHLDRRRAKLSMSNAAKAERTATRCCRRVCTIFCAPIGGTRVPACGCFPAGRLAIMSASPHCRRPVGSRDAR